MLRTHRRLAALLALPALLCACSKAGPTDPTEDDQDGTLPPFTASLRTDDAADRIGLETEPNAGVSATAIQVCLSVTSDSGWWKGVGVNRTEPNIQGEKKDGAQCTQAPAGVLTLTFWKAKGLGVHTQVGTRAVDLAAYGGTTLRIKWRKD